MPRCSAPRDGSPPAPGAVVAATANAAAMRFSLGVNYWPRRSATHMWQAFDRGEIAADFAQIAALGLDTVRIFLRWDDFAPAADALDPVMLDRFEDVLTCASETGLRVLPTLFCGHMLGVNFAPAWAIDAGRASARYPTVCGTRVVSGAVGDLYRGPLLDAQLFFARAIGERVRAHPAIVAWDIGNAFTAVHEPPSAKVVSGEHSTQPASEHEIAEWSRRLAGALREASQHPATAGTTADDLTHDRNIRLASLCAPFAFASMQGETVDLSFARSRLDPEALPYLALLTAAFSFKRVLVTSVGNPSCPRGKFSAFERYPEPHEPPLTSISGDDPVFAVSPCLTDDEMAAYGAAVLERLHQDGRLGAYWCWWTDQPDDAAAQPAFAFAPRGLSSGILRVDGSEKPVAEALRAFARGARDVVKAKDMPMIASAYYYRTLPTSTTTVFESFLGSLGDRRAGVR